MSHFDRVQYWNGTDDEQRTSYPCHDYARLPYETFLRGIDIDAPADVVFRWVCQPRRSGSPVVSAAPRSVFSGWVSQAWAAAVS